MCARSNELHERDDDDNFLFPSPPLLITYLIVHAIFFFPKHLQIKYDILYDNKLYKYMSTLYPINTLNVSVNLLQVNVRVKMLRK